MERTTARLNGIKAQALEEQTLEVSNGLSAFFLGDGYALRLRHCMHEIRLSRVSTNMPILLARGVLERGC